MLADESLDEATDIVPSSSVSPAVDTYLLGQVAASGRMIHASSTVSMLWLLEASGVTHESLKFM